MSIVNKILSTRYWFNRWIAMSLLRVTRVWCVYNYFSRYITCTAALENRKQKEKRRANHDDFINSILIKQSQQVIWRPQFTTVHQAAFGLPFKGRRNFIFTWTGEETLDVRFIPDNDLRLISLYSINTSFSWHVMRIKKNI